MMDKSVSSGVAAAIIFSSNQVVQRAIGHQPFMQNSFFFYRIRCRQA